MRRRRVCPRCALPVPSLALPRVAPEVRLVAVWVGRGAPERGGVGVVCHGNPGVMLVPRVGVRQEGGRGVAIVVT